MIGGPLELEHAIHAVYGHIDPAQKPRGLARRISSPSNKLHRWCFVPQTGILTIHTREWYAATFIDLGSDGKHIACGKTAGGRKDSCANPHLLAIVNVMYPTRSTRWDKMSTTPSKEKNGSSHVMFTDLQRSWTTGAYAYGSGDKTWDNGVVILLFMIAYVAMLLEMLVTTP